MPTKLHRSSVQPEANMSKLLLPLGPLGYPHRGTLLLHYRFSLLFLLSGSSNKFSPRSPEWAVVFLLYCTFFSFLATLSYTFFLSSPFDKFSPHSPGDCFFTLAVALCIVLAKQFKFKMFNPSPV